MREHFLSSGRRARAARGQYPQTKPRATPKEGNRQNALARFNKISPGVRKKLEPQKIRRPSPKEGFHSFCNSKIEMKSQRATFRSRRAHLSSAERHRRSDSGAAVRLTRGGELGRAPATRRVAQFSAGCGQKQIGSAFAVLRTAGLVAQAA